MKNSAKNQNSGKNKRQETLAEQTRKQKDALLDQLTKCPIIQVACERTSVGRATYYSWRTNDESFCEIADKALKEGRKFISDIAESQLIQKIKEGNMTSIIYWLKNNCKRYSERFTDELDVAVPSLPPEQREQLMRAMKLTGLDALMKFTKEKEQKFLESIDKITNNKPPQPKLKQKVIQKFTMKKPVANITKGRSIKLNEFFKNHKNFGNK